MTERASRALRVSARIAAGVLLLVLLATVRVWVASAAEMRRAGTAVGRSDTHGAITHLRRAARWYAPLSPYPRDALNQLLTIAADAEAADDSATALRAYRAVRASTQATRSFYLPHADLAQRADRAIARITARVDVAEADVAETPDASARQADAMRALRDYEPPHVLWVVLALLGFAGFVAGVLGIALRAVDEEDRLVRPALRTWGGVAAIGLLLCAVALGVC